MPTQCQAGRHVKVNYTLLTFDNTEVRKNASADKECNERFKFLFEFGHFPIKELEPQLKLHTAHRLKAECMTTGSIWHKVETRILQNLTFKNPFQLKCCAMLYVTSETASSA